MSRTPAALLANLKVRFPTWRLQANDAGYVAVRGAEQVRAATLTELDERLRAADRQA